MEKFKNIILIIIGLLITQLKVITNINASNVSSYQHFWGDVNNGEVFAYDSVLVLWEYSILPIIIGILVVIIGIIGIAKEMKDNGNK